MKTAYAPTLIQALYILWLLINIIQNLLYFEHGIHYMILTSFILIIRITIVDVHCFAQSNTTGY